MYAEKIYNEILKEFGDVSKPTKQKKLQKEEFVLKKTIKELPRSYYEERYKYNKIKECKELTISEFSISASAKAITKIILKSYQKINPMELVNVESLSLIKNFNMQLTSFVILNLEKQPCLFNFYYFISLAKKLKKLGNFNSYSSVIKGLRCSNLNQEQIHKIKKLDSINFDVKINLIETEKLIRDLQLWKRKKDENSSEKFCEIISIFMENQKKNIKFNRRLEFLWIRELKDIKIKKVYLDYNNELSNLFLVL